VLGRVLLDVLTHRAELGASLVKPGEGLLDGQSGLGQAALSFAGKGLRGVQGAAGRTGGMNDEAAEALRHRTLIGVARAAANFNDLEVVADYTKRLEINFLREIDAGYPQGHDTEQLRMCVKGLGGVVESFIQASSRSMEELIATLLPRARQIVNESVGLESASTSAASNFLGGPVLQTTNATTVLDYNMDDAAFELSQISEGYMGRM
jgi:conserved oligomeric Golgi complex subunit 4